MSGPPRQNCAAKDMIRSMIAHTVYLFNRVPIKIVIKTPYELWIGKSPNIRNLHIWGCPAETRPYISYEKQLDLRTINCLFVGYSKRYRSFRFYCLSAKNIKTDNAKFFEVFRTVRTL